MRTLTLHHQCVACTLNVERVAPQRRRRCVSIILAASPLCLTIFQCFRVITYYIDLAALPLLTPPPMSLPPHSLESVRPQRFSWPQDWSTALMCGHVFHEACLFRLSEMTNVPHRLLSCPTCRFTPTDTPVEPEVGLALRSLVWSLCQPHYSSVPASFPVAVPLRECSTSGDTAAFVAGRTIGGSVACASHIISGSAALQVV